MKKLIMLFLCAASMLRADTAVTNAWDVDVLAPVPFVTDIWRGETIAMTARTGISNIAATAEFLWQTNGMESSWWSTNATVTASGDVTALWTPAMDTGASVYSFFFKVGGIYRPSGTIKMKGSPGTYPNEVALPVRSIDFATVTVLNPPWATTNEIDAAIAAILESDPVAGAWQTNHLAAANPHGVTAEGIGAASTNDVLWKNQGDWVTPRDGRDISFYDSESSIMLYAGLFLYNNRFSMDAPLADESPRNLIIPWNEIAEYAAPHTIATREEIDAAVAEVEEGVTNAAHDVATSLIGHPHVLAGSTVVPTTNAVLSVTGVASNGVGGVVHLMPYQATRPSEAGSTGALHIATAPGTYIVDVSGEIRVSLPEYGSTPQTWFPVEWRSERVDATNWIVWAWAPGAPATYTPKAGEGYYATLSNLVVHTYDRPGYTPGALTNDTAALPLYADTPDVRTAPGRLVATAGSVRSYMDSRKAEFAKAAWRYTPSGAAAPSSKTVTLDLPLVQQGQIAYLQSGDYFALSYEGGDWVSSSTGSVWRIGASGRADFTITAEARMAHILDFAVDVQAQTATIYASTNWMTEASAPYAEFNLDMGNPQWLACQNCVATYHADAVNGDYWTFVAPATEDAMFYRIMIPGGERRIISGPTHRFLNGIEIGGNIYNIITITNGAEVVEVLGRRVP